MRAAEGAQVPSKRQTVWNRQTLVRLVREHERLTAFRRLTLFRNANTFKLTRRDKDPEYERGGHTNQKVLKQCVLLKVRRLLQSVRRFETVRR